VIGGYKMIEIGRVIVKLAGRDAGRKGLIIDILDDKFVLIDGETRRRKCNILHLEPLAQVVTVKKNASHEEVAKALKEIGVEARETKPKPKSQKPRTKRKTPEQLREQKQEKKKSAGLFKSKAKKTEAKQETTLEAKAGLEAKEAKPSEKKESKPKEKPKKKLVWI